MLRFSTHWLLPEETRVLLAVMLDKNVGSMAKCDKAVATFEKERI